MVMSEGTGASRTRAVLETIPLVAGVRLGPDKCFFVSEIYPGDFRIPDGAGDGTSGARASRLGEIEVEERPGD
jgi:hypothetical protein